MVRPRLASAALPAPAAAPAEMTPATKPAARAVTAFAAITSPRRGVTSSVGRMVPLRISLVIESAPSRPANSAPRFTPTSVNTPRWSGRLVSLLADRPNPCSSTASVTSASIAATTLATVHVERSL